MHPTRDTESLSQFVEFCHCKRDEVQLEELTLHAEYVDKPLGIIEVCHDARESVFREFVHGAHVSVGVDHVRTNDELIRRCVDEAVRVRAVTAFGSFRDVEVFVDFVETRARSRGLVRKVGDHPESSCPWHERTNAAFAPRRSEVGSNGKARYDAADIWRERIL